MTSGTTQGFTLSEGYRVLRQQFVLCMPCGHLRATAEGLAEGDGLTGLQNSGTRFCVIIEPQGFGNLRCTKQ